VRLGLYFAVCDPLALDTALAWAAGLGIECIEVSSHVSARFDVDEMLESSSVTKLRDAVGRHGLELSAINMSADGQLLLGPHHSDTDWIHRGSTEEKRAFGARRLRRAAQLAEELEVPVVTGFVGCEDYSRWFPWPEAEAWERMEHGFVEELTPLLACFQAHGVRFAMEPHPKQFVYNTETALRSLKLLDGHHAWGFNLDPANLMLAGVDPGVFANELGDRINVHAKDGELVAHHGARSGLLANGPWSRAGRGFRFRVAGWGDVQWKRLITELSVQGYHGPVAIEHEDPTMAPAEGVQKAAAFLEPLLIRGPSQGVWS
jgi:sugar phosphate isomerase/epimerase